MLRKISDSINHCVKCDDETEYLNWCLNQDLLLEPVCWRCLDRKEKHINTKPGWKRMGRNLYSVPKIQSGESQNVGVGHEKREYIEKVYKKTDRRRRFAAVNKWKQAA